MSKKPNYFAVFGILAALTLIEVFVSYISVGEIKYPSLGIIAAVKALLVLLYFMHLRRDSRVYSYLFMGGFALSIPLILIMTIVMPSLYR